MTPVLLSRRVRAFAMPAAGTLMAAVVMAAIATVACGGGDAHRRAEGPASIEALIAACGETWSMEAAVARWGRVSLRGAPCDAKGLAARLALARLVQRQEKDRTDRATRERALGELITGSATTALGLVEPLIERAKASSEDLLLASAACLVLGDAGKDASWWFVRALDLAERGLTADDGTAPRGLLAFNRALALERLGLVAEARTRWTALQRDDPRGQTMGGTMARGAAHAQVVSARLRALDQRIEASSPSRQPDAFDRALDANDTATLDRWLAVDTHEARAYFDDHLLTPWARASQRDGGATRDTPRTRGAATRSTGGNGGRDGDDRHGGSGGSGSSHGARVVGEGGDRSRTSGERRARAALTRDTADNGVRDGNGRSGGCAAQGGRDGHGGVGRGDETDARGGKPDNEAVTTRMTRLRRLGERLEAATGDRLAIAMVTALSRSAAAARGQAARGLLLLFEGRRLQAADDLGPAAERLRRARGLLAAAGSPYALWAEVDLGVVSYQQGALAAAVRAWSEVERRAAAGRFLVLQGRARALLGLVRFVQGDLGDALIHDRRALDDFTRAREQDYLAYVHNLQADHLRTLGAPRRSWDQLREGLTRFAFASAVHQETLLLSAAQSATRDGLLHASARFHDLWVEHVDRVGTSLSKAEALMSRADLRHRLGDPAGARADLAQTDRWRRGIPDERLATLVEARLDATLAEIESRGDPRASVDHATRAIDFYTAASRVRRVPGLLLTRARGFLAMGRKNEAERDLVNGIDAFESQRSRVFDMNARVSFADASWDLYRDMIAFQAQRGRLDLAWVYAERARARVLGERLASRPAERQQRSDARAADALAADTPATVATRVPEGATVLHYTVLRDGLLVWRLTRGQAHPVLLTTDMEALSRRVRDFERHLEEDASDADLRADAEWLYDILIRTNPPSPDTPLLVIVPDAHLHRLAFGALVNRATGRYLIEEHSLFFTPNARLYAAEGPRRAARTPPSSRQSPSQPPSSSSASSAPSPHALIVASSQVQDEGVDLPALPGATREASAIASLYRDRVSLNGSAATKAGFVAELRRAEVVHFAGHALANVDNPDLSRLLLASDGHGGSGMLFAHELREAPMPNLRLVVLAACSTGQGAIVQGEGVLSLARPFLEAGVPAVVATLWDIADRDGQRVLPAFHAAWLRDGHAAAALRTAILDSWRTGGSEARRPGRWAGFVVVTSNTHASVTAQ